MTSSQTPRTEAFHEKWDSYNYPMDAIEFAADLERELNAARAEVAEKERKVRELQQDRDSALERLDKLIGECNDANAEIASLQAELAGSKRAIELLEEHHAEEIAELRERAEQVYKLGFIDGVTAYAWYKNGEQQVGTTGRTRKEAIANVEKTWNYAPDAAIRALKGK